MQLMNDDEMRRMYFFLGLMGCESMQAHVLIGVHGRHADAAYARHVLPPNQWPIRETP